MQRWRSLSVLILAVTAVYLYAFPAANIPYAIAVLLHTGLGVLATVGILLFLFRGLGQEPWLARFGWLFLLAGGALGIVLLQIRTPHRLNLWLYTHIALCIIGVLFLASSWLASHDLLNAEILQQSVRFTALALLIASISAGAWWTRTIAWKNAYRVSTPSIAPATMDQEGDGPNGKFFPSSVQTKDGNYIPSDYFLKSQACERCHSDIYKQWQSSMHHFSSFNNQWYRKSIEYMQEVDGVKQTKWCAGCHDPALLFSGMMDTPIQKNIHKPEASAGLSCMMCHSIVQVKSTMGQGDFVLEYPKLHELAASDNPVVRTLHDFLVRVNPEPHRRTFLKPFMRTQTAEFCASCHKVHLDVPVNHYRWIRGFNEYDNWQASGVSGEGARSFYYPPKPQQCADCHMPLEPSNDMGNVAGKVHSHRFPGANTALPTANEDVEQLKATENFLTSGALTVDIFALSPASATLKSGAIAQHELATTFAVGEEAEAKITPGSSSNVEATPVTAPLNRVEPTIRRGDTVRVDVVVRTKRVGHFFPGGTVDAYDTWLELKGVDDKGQTIFWSGMVEDDGKGPVEEGAHFYRSLQVDAHGNLINKRNAWATRAVVYVRLIPPGAADTVHFCMKVPAKTGNKITLTARLCYRKFSWFNTQFAFAGEHEKGVDENSSQSENAATTPDFDDAKMAFTASLSGVSARKEKIPDLPIVAVAQNEVAVDVLPTNAPSPQPKIQLAKEDWQRWNDYGIRLFPQGDLKAAQVAFEKVTQVDPQNPDGWVNIGRAALQEGDTVRARTVLEKALSLSPDLARAHFFYAGVLRQEGDYDSAAQHVRKVLIL